MAGNRQVQGVILAARVGAAADLKWMVEHGAFMEGVSDRGYSPVCCCTDFPGVQMIDILLERGADPDRMDGRGARPLHWAASYQRELLAKRMLRAGADPNIRVGRASHPAGPYYHGMTPLQLAFRDNNDLDAALRIAVHLINAGADVSRDVAGNSILFERLINLSLWRAVLALLCSGYSPSADQMRLISDVHPWLGTLVQNSRQNFGRLHLELSLHPDAIELGFNEMEIRPIRYFGKARQLILWRRGTNASKDANLVHRAAREGRPLELARRLRLGKLAGALDRQVSMVVPGPGGGDVRVEATPAEAAWLGGHYECLELLQSLQGNHAAVARKSFLDQYCRRHLLLG